MTGDFGQADRSAARAAATHDDTVDNVEFVRPRLQQRGGDVEGRSPHFERRDMRRIPSHDRGAGRMGADTVWDAVSLPRDDPYTAVVDAERVGTDLRHGRREALADRRAASHQLDSAAAVDADTRPVQRSKPAFLDKDGEPRPDQFAGSATATQLRLQRIPADLRQGLLEQSRIVAGVVDDFGTERIQLPA